MGLLSRTPMRLDDPGQTNFMARRGNLTLPAANAKSVKGAEFHFNFVSDATTRMLSLLNGEATIVERLEPEQVATLDTNPAVKVTRRSCGAMRA